MVHLSGVVGSVAGAVALTAVLFRRTLPIPLAVVLWHAAGAGFAVSAAASEHLARHTTWLLGKRDDGSITTLGLLLFWPYHVGLRGKLALQRATSTEPLWDKVAGHYFLGGWPAAQALLPAARPAVLDVTAELPLQVRPPAYKVLRVWDTHSPDQAQIEDGVRWAREQTQAGRPLLVHCAHGHGRSATLLGAILIAEGIVGGVEGAEALMKAARPKVRLNRRQRAALKAWAAARDKAR